MRKILAALIAILPGAAAAQDLAAGEATFNRICLACHAVGPDARNKVGPVLNGLNGRRTGTVEGYSYSAANRESGIVWDERTFLDYIKDPRKTIPGTKMFAPPVRNEQDALALWAYLKLFDATGRKPAAKPQ